MQTQKEILRDTILTDMQPYLSQVVMDILNQSIVRALARVEVTQTETLPATVDDTNDRILEIFQLKKEPKLSKETATYYKSSIKNLIGFTNKSLLKITDMDVEYYLQAYTRKGNKAITVNNERRNLSAFFTWMRKCHMITENPVDGVEKFQEIEVPIDHMVDEEMEALRKACEFDSKKKVIAITEKEKCLRDRALIEFLRSTAVRVTECSSVNIEDINWSTGEILVYGKKNRTYRTVCLDGAAKYHLRAYIDNRRDDNPALFVSTRGTHERLKKSGIECAIRMVADKSGINRRVYPHLFRKTTATNMVKRGCPRELVAFYLGHKNGNTKTLNKHYAATDPQQITQAFWKYGSVA